MKFSFIQNQWPKVQWHPVRYVTLYNGRHHNLTGWPSLQIFRKRSRIDNCSTCLDRHQLDVNQHRQWPWRNEGSIKNYYVKNTLMCRTTNFSSNCHTHLMYVRRDLASHIALQPIVFPTGELSSRELNWTNQPIL